MTAGTNLMSKRLSSYWVRARSSISLLRLAAMILCLQPVQIAKAEELPKASGAQVITLTPKPGYFTEPAIAVNPANPQQVVAVFQDNAHAAYSQGCGPDVGGGGWR